MKLPLSDDVLDLLSTNAAFRDNHFDIGLNIDLNKDAVFARTSIGTDDTWRYTNHPVYQLHDELFGGNIDGYGGVEMKSRRAILPSLIVERAVLYHTSVHAQKTYVSPQVLDFAHM
jgi:hypothetical protein